MTVDLEQRLLELGSALELPPAPDLAGALPARLPDRRIRAGLRPSPRTLAPALAALLLLAGAAMALPSTRHAILRVLGLRGVRIERVPELPPARADRGSRLGLGRRIPLARAVHAASFTALLPARGAAAYLADDVPGGRVSLLLGSVLVTEFRGTAFPFVLKLIGPRTTVKMLHVDGGPGVYLSGAPHALLIQTRGGTIRSDSVRLAGSVLIWQHGPLTLRIEGVHSLTQALGVARSLGSTGRGGPVGCPVSKPAGPRPPLFALRNFDQVMAKPSDPGWLGNGALWTQLPPALRTFRRGPGGMLVTKIGWFRAGPGPVTITGAPLYGPPARFSADVGNWTGYGRTGFLPSLLAFGREGCWVLHARLGKPVLRLVVEVGP